MFGIKVNDIRRPVNFRECIRYVTKEDRQAILLNIPLKFTSTVYRVIGTLANAKRIPDLHKI